MPSTQVRFIDLFAGIGGFHRAMESTGRAKCVFASEWDKHARQTYALNYPVRLEGEPAGKGAPLLAGDITKVAPDSIPDFDILCGGFPCQPFSHAGFKKGFADTRGTLFFNIAEILRAKKPAAFLLENVRGLMAHDKGNTLKTITRVLKELGYTPAGGGEHFHHLVMASDYGVPQHRPRVFMVGFLVPARAAAWKAPAKIPLAFTMSEVMGGRVTMDDKNLAERKIGYTLRCGGKNSGVGDRRNWDCYMVDGVEKRLSVAQATRMQGFPESFRFPEGMAQSHAMKQLGNSVAVPAVKAWAESILDALK